MAKINDYYQKKQLMEKLAAELEKLEKDQALKSELEFENKVRELMKQFDKSPKDVLQILSAIDPSIAGGKVEVAAGTRAKRPLKIGRASCRERVAISVGAGWGDRVDMVRTQ